MAMFFFVGIPIIIFVLTIVRFFMMMESKEERYALVPNIRWSAAGCLIGVLCYAYGGAGMLVAFLVVFAIILIWRVGASPGVVRAICIIPAVPVLLFIGLAEMPKTDRSRCVSNCGSPWSSKKYPSAPQGTRAVPGSSTSYKDGQDFLKCSKAVMSKYPDPVPSWMIDQLFDEIDRRCIQ